MGRKPTLQQLYKKKNEYLAENFEQVTPAEFYRDVFPEGWLERAGHPEDNKPNAIFGMAYTKDETPEQAEERKNFKNIFNTTLEAKYKEYCSSTSEPVSFEKFKKINSKDIRYELRKKYKPRYVINKLLFDDLTGLNEVLKAKGAEFVITSPVSYSGRTRKSENAYHLWGITIDLDGVTPSTLKDLHYQIQNKVLPCPTYLVNSGTGLHVYYLFEEPIPLYHYLHEPLNLLKKGLTEIVWNAYTSALPPEEKQYQGIFQGFRCPGSPSKLGKRYPVTAFRVGKKGMLMDLNDFVADTYRVNYNELTHITLDEAKQKWPEWYQKRIVGGAARGRYTYNRAVYDKWLQRVKKGAFQGNRYWCVAMMAVNAIKCDIEFEEVFKDAVELLPYLNSLTTEKGEEFTISDVYEALNFYEESFVFYPRDAMETHTKIKLPETKRNGRDRDSHIKLMNYVRDEINKNTEWRNKDGRPKGIQNKNYFAQELIRQFRNEHPEGTKKQCKDETGLTYPTIRKWWDIVIFKDEWKDDSKENNVFEFTKEEHAAISWGLLEKK